MSTARVVWFSVVPHLFIRLAGVVRTVYLVRKETVVLAQSESGAGAG